MVANTNMCVVHVLVHENEGSHKHVQEQVREHVCTYAHEYAVHKYINTYLSMVYMCKNTHTNMYKYCIHDHDMNITMIN